MIIFLLLFGSCLSWNFTWSESDIDSYGHVGFGKFRNLFKWDDRYRFRMEEHFRALKRDCFNSRKCKRYKNAITGAITQGGRMAGTELLKSEFTKI